MSTKSKDFEVHSEPVVVVEVGSMERALQRLGRQIDESVKTAEDSTHQALDELEARRTRARKALASLKVASDEAYLALSAGGERAWDDLQLAWADIKKASEDALAKFNK